MKRYHALEVKLDRAVSAYTRKFGVCKYCGKFAGKENLHSHHLIGRSNNKMRHELKNNIPLCVKCHKIAHDQSATFRVWAMMNTYLYELLETSRETVPADFIERQYEKLKPIIKEYL